MTTCIYWPGRFVAADRKVEGGIYHGNTDVSKIRTINIDEFDHVSGSKRWFKIHMLNSGGMFEWDLLMPHFADFASHMKASHTDPVARAQHAKAFIDKAREVSESDFSAIVVFRTQDFEYAFFFSDKFVEFVNHSRNQPIAIGSGSMFALGSMWIMSNREQVSDEVLIRKAIHTAMHFDSGTGFDFDQIIFEHENILEPAKD